MTVHELIEELKKIPNQEAEISVYDDIIQVGDIQIEIWDYDYSTTYKDKVGK